MNKLVIGLISIFCSLHLFGQNNLTENIRNTTIDGTVEGYYITLEGKIISGIKLMKIDPVNRSREVIVPTQEKHSYQLFHPSDIIGYGYINNRIWYKSAMISFEGKDQNVFLEEFLKDENGVVFYIYTSPQGEELYYAQRGKQTMQLITNPQIIREYFRNKSPNCDKIQYLDKIPIKMSRNSIEKMHEAYSNCNLNIIRKLSFGITTSFNLYLLNADHQYRPKFTIYPGIYIHIPLDNHFSFRPEFIYSYLNATKKWHPTDFRTTKFKRQSIMIPFMFRYTFTQIKGSIIPYVEAGPICDFKISKDKQSTEKTIYRKTHTFEPGIAYGGGVEWKASSYLSIHTGLRYTFLKGMDKQDRQDTHYIPAIVLSLDFHK